MRYHLVTLGCPKNVADSDKLEALLRQGCHEPADRPARADLIVVNTCGFLEAAREESINWVVAGIVVLFLLAAGLLLYRSGGSEGGGGGIIPNRPTEAPTTESVVEAAPPPVEPTIEAPAAETPTAEVPPAEGTPAETLPAEPQGRPIEPTEPGIVPDFDGAALDAALAVLQDKGMDYVLVEVENRDVPEGLVFDQSPSPGSELQDDESVTLVVSRATR